MIPTVAADIVERTPGTAEQISVSVITPVYNPGFELIETARSLKAQTLRNFEWIIVDDGSNEICFAPIVEAISQVEVPVTLVRHRQNWHQGQARNTGLTQARASYIKFLDADDAIDCRHLELLLSAARAVTVSRIVAFAPTQHVFLNSGKFVVNHSYRSLVGKSGEQLARLLTAPFLHHCGALFPVVLLQDLGGYDATLVTDEDGDLLVRVLLAGWRFEAVPDVYYIYRHHTQAVRVSRDDTAAKIAARYRVGEKVLRAFEVANQEVPAVIKAALCWRLDALAVRNWSRYPAEACELLAAARALDADYVWSGSRLERAIRRLAGIAVAQRVIEAWRAARGVTFA